MSSSQKFSKKDFCLTQYYSQLEKYQTHKPSSKHTPLKRQASHSSLAKQRQNTTHLAKSFKDQYEKDKQKLGIANQYLSKTSFEKYDRSKLETFKKNTQLADIHRSINIAPDSLTTSNATYKKWLNESQCQQKENIPFTKKQEERFIQHCSQLYQLQTNNDSILNEISKEINKRDQVYQVVSQHFGPEQKEHYPSLLQKYFQENELMRKIIEQFKNISKLQISDMSELYYFLKSDA